MKIKTLFRKGTSKKIGSSKMSASQRRHLAKAVVVLQSNSIKDLIEQGQVKKLRVNGRDDVYSYRMGMNERVVFSPVDGKNIIHDVVDLRTKGSLIE